MTDEDAQALLRENAYLKSRNAQLQADIIDLNGDLGRLRQDAERRAAPRSAPNPLAGGQ